MPEKDSPSAPDGATPYRGREAATPQSIGPVKCCDCAHWTDGPPMDCAKVPTDLRYRSLVNKHWTAESDGCCDFAPRPMDDPEPSIWDPSRAQWTAPISALARRIKARWSR